MLHVQLPSMHSMPSRFMAGSHELNTALPSIPQLRGFESDWNKAHSREGKCTHTPPIGHSWHRRGPTDPNHGLQTPPRDSNSMDGNPLLQPNAGAYHYKRVPAITSNPPSYQTSQSTLQTNGPQINRQPFYDSYYSARKLSSPVPGKKEEAAQSEQTARRRASIGGNAIASHLQIPASINDSKGSLPEFAAQITCFFWFESSFILHLIEDSVSTPIPSAPLVAEAMPTTGFRKWVTTILSMTQVSQNVILLALMFIYRLKRLSPGVKGKVGSEFRLLTVALMLGNKFLDDNTYTNKTWAEVSGISVQEIHVMEVEFLSNMRYTLYASGPEWNAWHTKLGKFSDYYDKASRLRLENTPRNISLPNPFNNMPPNAPSPPGSQPNISPPFPTNLSPSNPPGHPLSGPPYLAPMAASPLAPMPDVDMTKPWPRKRSLEDYTSDPPPKRLSSFAPSAASSTTLTPSTIKNNTPPLPRLPMPNLSISTGNSYTSHGSSPAQATMPSGRAMSTVFPGPSKWAQNGSLPSLQPLGYMNPTNGPKCSSPTDGQQPRQSHYGSGSATPSPTSLHFPPQQNTPINLSPSGLPAVRNSPYKPIRGVNTLLVPPPSASMLHHQPQNLSHDQMHYQPLGKPVSERRTGVLPYLPFDTWSNTHPTQHYLPQPNFSS